MFMVTKHDISFLLNTTRYHFSVRVCSISPGSGTQLCNPHGTLMKQADRKRTGLLKAEIWARSGENVGRI